MTKTLRKACAAILVGIVVFMPVLSIVFPAEKAAANPAVVAPSGDGKNYLDVHLTGANIDSSYVVKAVRKKASTGGFANTIAFSYKSGGVSGIDSSSFFLSDDLQIPWSSTCIAGNGGSTNATEEALLTYSISVTKGGKSVGPTQTYDFCGTGQYSGGAVWGPVTIAVSGVAAQTGCVTGTLAFTDSSGTVKPFVGSASSGSLTQTTGSKTKYDLSIDSSGKFTKSGLPFATYALDATYNPGPGQEGGVINSADSSAKTVTVNKAGSSGSSCASIGTVNSSNLSGSAAPAATGTGTDNTDKSVIQCTWSDNAITFFVCPVVTGMIDFINTADEFITNSLEFDSNPQTSIFSGSTDTMKEYYTAWNQFRIIATAIIVIAGLVMVASQALGFEILDAYTIKKVMPRLIIASIAISISWPLMKFAVGFVNTLGVDIRNIIFYPFSGIKDELHTGALGLGLGGLLLGGIFLGIMGALSFGLTALLAIGTAFAIIVFRDLALILMIIIAPVGIAGYILPNTNRMWKLWIDNFLGLLLMFPIIEAIIAAGHVFAAISLGPNGADTSATGSGILSQVIGFSAYFVPYFLLPAAFKLATGAIGTIAGVMGGHGLGERLKKYRGGVAAKNARDLKAGSRFNQDSRLTKMLGGNAVNRVGAHAGAGVRGRFGFGSTGAAARANNAFATSDSMAKENGAFAAQMNNEDAMISVAAGNNRNKLAQLSHFRNSDGTINTAKLDGALAAGRSVGSDQRTQVAALDALAKSGKVIGNNDELDTVLSSAAHGNSAMKGALEGQYRFTSRQVGRSDIGRGAVKDAAGNVTSSAAYESLKEMDMGTVGKLKPLAAANLFATGTNANGQVTESAWHGAVQEAKTPEEKQHMYDVLFAAQYSPSTSPEQQAKIAQTIAGVQGHDEWEKAKSNYRAKFAPGEPGGPTEPTP